MSKTVQKEFTVNEVLNIFKFYNAEMDKISKGEDSVLDKLSNVTRWNLKRNLNEFKATADDFDKFDERVSESIKNDWFYNDEKSELIEEALKDENGEDLLDDDGKPQTREMRRIKEEFVEAYEKRMIEYDNEMLEILNDSDTYNIKTSNVGDEIEKFIDELSEEELMNISILLFMDDTNE